MKPIEVWTDRVVRFEWHAGQDVDAMMDALVARFWEPKWRNRIWRTPGICNSVRTADLAGIPRWIPLWYARRVVAQVMAEAGMSGTVTTATERVVLIV